MPPWVVIWTEVDNWVLHFYFVIFDVVSDYSGLEIHGTGMCFWKKKEKKEASTNQL